MHHIADPSDSLLGWASQHELTLAQQLKGLELVHELGLRSDELERIERFFGIFLDRQITAGASFANIATISPALTLITLVSRAADVVDPRNFAVEYAAGLQMEHQEALVEGLNTELVVELLGTVGVGFAGQEGLDLVTLLCLHAGLINAEVAPLLEYLDEQRSAPPSMFAELQRALPEAAQNVLVQVTGVRDLSLAHPKSWFDRHREQFRGSIVEAVAAELRERPAHTPDRLSAVGVAARELRPRVLLDLQKRKLYLRLPEQEVAGAAGEVSWRVNVEGSTKVYRTGVAWGSESGFAEALDLNIESPVRELIVQDVTHQITWTVPVIDHQAPLLLFTERGMNITDKASLHYPSVVALCPADTQLHDPVRGTALPIEELGDLEGFPGWTLRRVDLREAAALAASESVGAEHAGAVGMRSVDTRARVTFHHPGQPVPFVRTLAGLRVHTESLVAEFPPTPSGAAETWQLTISAYGGLGAEGEEVVPAEQLEIPATGGAFQVFDPTLYDAPWVGEYHVRLRGPRGESFRHEYAIVEGMRTKVVIQGANKAFRIPTAGGLSEVSLEVASGDKPFEATEAKVGPQEAATNFVVSTHEGDQLPLRFTPPRLVFELPALHEPRMWRASRLALRPRDIDLEGTLRVRGYGELKDALITICNQHGSPLASARLQQADQVQADQMATYHTPIAKLVGQSGNLPTGRLDIQWTDPSSHKRVSVALADLQVGPEPTLSLVDGAISLPGQYSLWVWPATAPWEPARALAAADGQVALPEDLRDAGPLIVQPFLADPFATQVTPVAPAANAVTLEQPGYFAGSDPALAGLAAFLAGESEQVPDNGAAMPLLWDMIGAGTLHADAVKAVRKVFLNAPAQALAGLADSLVPSTRQPGRVVESGLVRASFGSGAVHGSGWVAALALLGQLDELVADPEQLDADLRKQRQPLLEHLEQVAGANLLKTLRTGRDDTLDTACIDSSTVAIAAMDSAQQEALLEMFFAQSNIVPGALMDDGSRLLAVFEAFTKREELVELFQENALIAAAVTMLRTLRSTDRVLYALARVRFDKLDGVDTDAKENLWALAPVVSLIFALVARLHAHGLISSNKTLEAATPGWARLADLVPDLVTSDLVASEAIVLALKKPGIA